MTLSQASAKMDLRLNKGASGDYDNLWSYQKEEAFNKGVSSWVRRQKKGINITQEGDEVTDGKIDDLQVLLKSQILSSKDKGLFNQTEKLPTDYLYYKRITPLVSKDSCSKVEITSHLREEANVDDLRALPSFNFEETFHTIIGNRIHIYHNKDFTIDSVLLTYYRQPKQYSFKSLTTVIEFKNDVCEILVDEACKILSSDTEMFNQKSVAEERVERED